MADNDQKPIDLDTLSDEEFLKLDPSTLQPFVPSEGDSDESNEPVVEPSNEPDPNAPASDGSEEGTEGDQPDGEADPKPEGSKAQPFGGSSNEPNSQAKPDAPKAGEKPAAGSKPSDADPKPEGKKAETPSVTEQVAQEFFKKVTAPFKADGKDIQVRSPEDAIRLMQMGVNYSRRMAEMKPLRAQNEMLKAHGLDNPEKLNFVIELMQGKPDAIQKLLKDKKIDPIDIDTTKETGYKPSNYQVDAKTLGFREAIEQTLASEGGPDLIKEINSSWDDTSKEALRDQPAIFQNLLDQKKSGVYVKIKKELDYQRTMGFLANVPFVQAYHQVGEAMQKAGVFGPNLTPKPKTPQVQPTGQVPIDTGPRKAAQNSVAPNPNLSSTQQPRAVAPNGNSQPSQPDYWTMSDEDFLKLKPPA